MARHGMAQHGTAWHGMAEHGTAWHSMVRHGMAQLCCTTGLSPCLGQAAPAALCHQPCVGPGEPCVLALPCRAVPVLHLPLPHPMPKGRSRSQRLWGAAMPGGCGEGQPQALLLAGIASLPPHSSPVRRELLREL